MRVGRRGSTALISTGYEQRRSGGPGCAQPTITVFWIAQEGLSMLAGTDELAPQRDVESTIEGGVSL